MPTNLYGPGDSYDLNNTLVEPSRCPLINVGTGEDGSIRELAEIIAKVVGYKGKFVQDTSKPDGTMRKLLDVGLISRLGWKAQTGLQKGLALIYANYLAGIPAQ